MIYSYFEDIFPYDKFPVEYLCFQKLKDERDINYIAIPWTQILNSNWLDFPNKQPMQYYINEISKLNIEQKNNFTICQHDDYMRLIDIFKFLNINTVFSPLHDKNNFITKGINIIPIAFTCSFNFDDTKNKNIPVSFVGTYTSHPIRGRMLNKINGNNIIYRDSYHIDSNSFSIENYRKKEEEEYKDILERSRFSLCPRGSSPSSVRFWESLAAGSIPILISDDWVLPEWDWSNTIISIPEDEFDNLSYIDIINIIDKIPQDKEELMKQNCLKAYRQFGQNNFKNYIKKLINK
jgi:hypothetical protein